MDGLAWTYSLTVPFSNKVAYTDGSVVMLQRRERPHLIFDKAGYIIALTNGVQPPPSASRPQSTSKHYQNDYTYVSAATLGCIAACLARAAVPTRVRCLHQTLAQPVKPQSKAAEAPASPRRQVLGWLYPRLSNTLQFTPTEWTRMLAALQKHKDNITIVSGTTYSIGDGGGLEYYGITDPGQNRNTSAHWVEMGTSMERHSPTIAKMGIAVHPLILASGDCSYTLGTLVANASATSLFIEAALAKAEQFQFSGFNLDIECSAAGADAASGVAMLEFINRFAAALHAKHMVLSIDVGGGTFGLDETKLSGSAIDYVFDMSTYSPSPAVLTATVPKMIKQYGAAKYGAGLEKNAAMLDHAALDNATAAGLQMLAVWTIPGGPYAGYPADSNATYTKWVDDEEFWAAAGYFLHHAAPGPTVGDK